MATATKRRILTIETHGTSGRWYPCSDEFSTMYDALTACKQTKKEGYGVRILADGVVVMDASWQTPVDWSVQ